MKTKLIVIALGGLLCMPLARAADTKVTLNLKGMT